MDSAIGEGRGVPADCSTALDWFSKAAEKDHVESAAQAARLYLHGLNAPAQALSWFLRAVKGGFSESHIEVASIYANREFEAYDPVEAVKWYELAANHRFRGPTAMLALACLCRNGIGTPHDPGKAREWLRRLQSSVKENSPLHRRASKLLKKMETELL